MEADVFVSETSRASMVDGTSLHHLRGRHGSRREKEPVQEGFMCPECKYKFPMWKALLMTRWTHFTCPTCKKRLSPILREIETFGMITGMLGFAGATIIMESVSPQFDLWIGISGVIGYTTVLLFVMTVLSNKYVHLEISNDQGKCTEENPLTKNIS